jgi:hypothetical protein
MEHDTGSGHDPAVSSTPEELSSAQPAGAGAAGGVAEASEAAASEPGDPAAAAETGETVPPVAADAPADAPAATESAEPHVAEETAEAAAELDEAGEELTTAGEPRVDAVLGRLGELDELPVSEHPGVYERIHEQLVDVLGELHHGPQNR